MATASECHVCKKPLGWVDKVYGHAGKCKRCTREGEEAILRGTRKPWPYAIPLSHGADRTLAMTRRVRLGSRKARGAVTQ